MTAAVWAGACVATVADMLAYVALIVPGAVREANPVIAMTLPAVALVLRALLLIALTAYAYLFAETRPWLVRGVLIVAAMTGLVGFASTVIA